jgi:hypothetical protein
MGQNMVRYAKVLIFAGNLEALSSFNITRSICKILFAAMTCHDIYSSYSSFETHKMEVWEMFLATVYSMETKNLPTQFKILNIRMELLRKKHWCRKITKHW